MRGMDEMEGPADLPENLTFTVFVLSHTTCGDGPFELRLDGGALLEWCTACAKTQVFIPADGNAAQSRTTDRPYRHRP